MASVTWALANVDFDIDDGFCHTAHWTVTRVDGDYSASSYGSCALTKPESLTSYNQEKYHKCYWYACFN